MRTILVPLLRSLRSLSPPSWPLSATSSAPRSRRSSFSPNYQLWRLTGVNPLAQEMASSGQKAPRPSSTCTLRLLYQGHSRQKESCTKSPPIVSSLLRR